MWEILGEYIRLKVYVLFLRWLNSNIVGVDKIYKIAINFAINFKTEGKINKIESIETMALIYNIIIWSFLYCFSRMLM